MKKQYLPAEIEIIVLSVDDVLSVSDLEKPEFDENNGGSAGWT